MRSAGEGTDGRGGGGHTDWHTGTHRGHGVSRRWSWCFIMRICHSMVEIKTGKFNIAIINSFDKSILDNVFL